MGNCRYLKEVGFPDNVLEARVARINMYHSLVSESGQKEAKAETEVAVNQAPVKYSTSTNPAEGKAFSTECYCTRYVYRYDTQRYRHCAAIPFAPSGTRYCDHTLALPTLYRRQWR